jgi:serralysin
LVGFLGNDIYLINNTDEVVVENAGEGTDIVYVNSSYTLSANASIELLSTYSIAGTQAYDLTGNNLDNTIWGNRGQQHPLRAASAGTTRSSASSATTSI